ncbi:hypothetical protein ANASTE_00912 [Anaerofustis stercorihominis DSM 17244]|uniref:Uncharacterized protein n=1 Tax=Anaerofustis stercorihominis DSM 17244 TaxID=445971 RepID=B1C856_9FIRM|nr:hypothetical protein ANASTE_00912 [Anaerofustis stercorihominis DSM 17244]
MCLGTLNNTSGFASARFASFHKFFFFGKNFAGFLRDGVPYNRVLRVDSP